MRICYLNKGKSIHDNTVLTELVKQGNEVHLVTFHSNVGVNIPGLKVHHIPVPNPYLAFPLALLLMPFILRKIKPDVVIGNYMISYGFYAAVSGYHPLIQKAWGSDVLLAPGNPFLRQIVKFSLSRGDLAIVDCEAHKQAIINLGFPPDKIMIMAYGINSSKFNPDVQPNNFREEIGWKDNPVVICTRRHYTVYGMQYLIEAMASVVEDVPEARFLFIGSGSETEKMKKQASDLGIDSYIKFTGTIPNEELPGYLAASDVYVSSSLSDGTSVCLLEAMAVGLPVVVTDVAAIMEWVTDGENGLVVPRKDPQAMATALIKILKDAEARKTYGEINQQIIRERGTWEQNALVLEKAYKTVTGQE